METKMKLQLNSVLIGIGIVILSILCWKGYETYKEVQLQKQAIREVATVLNNVSTLLTEHINEEKSIPTLPPLTN